jgi:plasmid stability protein
MKNITVSVDDETYRRARVKAAEADTSVSALVKQFLSDLASGESEFDRLEKLQRDVTAGITAFNGSSRLSRDELYERRR